MQRAHSAVAAALGRRRAQNVPAGRSAGTVGREDGEKQGESAERTQQRHESLPHRPLSGPRCSGAPIPSSSVRPAVSA